MSEKGKEPPSLRDFDYFDEHMLPPVSQPPPSERPDDFIQDEGLVRPHKLRLRAFTTATVTLCFSAVSVWFTLGYLDVARYAFQEPSEPLEMGDVSDLTPDQIPHNRYVTVHGITEHRGLRQKAMRGLALGQEEYWYFRLLGSRGVFVEVLPDPNKYGITTEVTASGRVVDPARAPMYRDLLKSYQDIFVSENRGEARVIQVGLKPGEHRQPYIVAMAVLASLLVANLMALGNLMRTMWRGQ